MRNTLHFYIISIVFVTTNLKAQQVEVDLGKVVNEWTLGSPQAKTLTLSYRNELLEFENYRKSFLPSFSLALNPLGFNRSLKSIQHPDDGSYSYVEDYLNSSNIGITINQKVGFTGGSLNVTTYLNTLTEFPEKRNSFSATPFSISYTQQLFGGNHTYKREKNIRQLKHYNSIKQYCSSLAEIQTQSVSLFMDVFLSWLNRQLSERNVGITDTLLTASKLLLERGRITEYDYKQVEFQHFSNQYNQVNSEKSYSKALRQLFLYLGVDNPEVEEVKVVPPIVDVPQQIDYRQIARYAEMNNPFKITQEIKKKEAELQLYTLKLSNRFNANINISYGLNQYAENLIDAYRNPNSRQSFSVGFQIPLFQWGIGRNNVKIAEHTYESTIIALKDAELQFENRLEDIANDYNHAVNLCHLARQAFLLSQEQYEMLSRKFLSGKVSVYELSNVQQEQFSAMQKYYTSMKTVWESYYSIRHLTLFDLKENKELAEILMPKLDL